MYIHSDTVGSFGRTLLVVLTEASSPKLVAGVIQVAEQEAKIFRWLATSCLVRCRAGPANVIECTLGRFIGDRMIRCTVWTCCFDWVVVCTNQRCDKMQL